LESIPAELLWFIGGLVFFLSELALPGFIIIFFGIGAWAAAITSWVGLSPSFNSQVVVFIAISVFSLVLLRKKSQQYFLGRVSGKLKDNLALDDMRGERAVVTVDIQPGKISGKVELHGTSWEAESDTAIGRGATVEIVERKNLTLYVKPVSRESL